MYNGNKINNYETGQYCQPNDFISGTRFIKIKKMRLKNIVTYEIYVTENCLKYK